MAGMSVISRTNAKLVMAETDLVKNAMKHGDAAASSILYRLHIPMDELAPCRINWLPPRASGEVLVNRTDPAWYAICSSNLA